MRINEIFYSLQGEGAHTGRAAVFVRFSGCNLACRFCDTLHGTYKEYSAEEVWREIAAFPSRHLVFTGGEPALQLTAETVRFFKERGYYLQVETNGTRPLPEGIDWITCSPKDAYCPGAEVKLDRADEVKVVFDGIIDPAKYLALPAACHTLQPCDTGDKYLNDKIVKQCVAYILDHPEWRLSLQTHKILNVQ